MRFRNVSSTDSDLEQISKQEKTPLLGCLRSKPPGATRTEMCTNGVDHNCSPIAGGEGRVCLLGRAAILEGAKIGFCEIFMTPRRVQGSWVMSSYFSSNKGRGRENFVCSQKRGRERNGY